MPSYRSQLAEILSDAIQPLLLISPIHSPNTQTLSSRFGLGRTCLPHWDAVLARVEASRGAIVFSMGGCIWKQLLSPDGKRRGRMARVPVLV